MLPRSLPEPELFLPERGKPALRWGVLGAGWIAGFFVAAVQKHTAQKVVAVAARAQAKAESFAEAHSIPTGHSSVDALLDDPGVDVIYVAAPQSEHLSLGLRAIAAGKHVLMEKPLATSAADARMSGRDAVRLGEALGLGLGARGDGDHVLRGVLLHGVDEEPCDPAGAEDTPAQRRFAPLGKEKLRFGQGSGQHRHSFGHRRRADFSIVKDFSTIGEVIFDNV